MKKAILFLLIAVTAFSLAACTPKAPVNPDPGTNGGDVTPPNNTTPKPGISAAKILGHTLGKDKEDKDILIVEYEFKNDSGLNSPFVSLVMDTATQGDPTEGVTPDDSILSALVTSDEFDAAVAMSNKIEAGATVTIKRGYLLRDTSTPIKIKLTDQFGTETYLEETLTPTQPQS